jgi:hypothetical protein
MNRKDQTKGNEGNGKAKEQAAGQSANDSRTEALEKVFESTGKGFSPPLRQR